MPTSTGAHRIISAPQTPNRRKLAAIFTLYSDHDAYEADANARLTAASPELLAALEAVIDARPIGILSAAEVAAWELAAAAISKARTTVEAGQ